MKELERHWSSKEEKNWKRAEERQIVPKVERGLASTGAGDRASGTLAAERASCYSHFLFYLLNKSQSCP